MKFKDIFYPNRCRQGNLRKYFCGIRLPRSRGFPICGRLRRGPPMFDKVSAPPLPINYQIPPFAYRARPPRHRTLLGGKLVFGDSDMPPTLTLDCTIRNISEGGAKVTLDDRQPLAPDLYLISITRRVAYRARVMWMKFPARGLQFLQTYFLEKAIPEELGFLRTLYVDLDWRSGIDNR
jgi:hypothetical protein